MPTDESGWLFTIGDTFADRYDVRALVGQGTHGAVFEATDTTTQERVALKLIHPELLENDSGDNLFLLKRALAYRSQEIIPVKDIIEEEDKVVLVSPYVYAPNLRTHLQLKSDTKESFGALEGLRLVTDIAAGLSWVHRFGAHGNLKPENIFVTKDGYRLNDAYRLNGIQRLSWSPDNPWTKDTYQAPEQYRGISALETDVYALSIMIGEALAGKPIKDGIPLSAQSNLVSFEAFDELFLAATSRDANERPSFESFISDAGTILSGAGENEAGAERDMNITLVTGIPVISESMMKDLEDGFSAKEVIDREDERATQEDSEDDTPLTVPELEAQEFNDEAQSLIGGTPLAVDFGVIVGRSISAVLSQDLNVGRPREPMDDGAEVDELGIFEPSQSVTIHQEDAKTIFGAQVDTEDKLPIVPPALPTESEDSPFEDASVLELLPDEDFRDFEDEEAEVFAEFEEILAAEGGMGDLIDLEDDTEELDLVELSSDALTVEELSPEGAKKLEEQITVQALGEARDLIADDPKALQPPPLRNAIDPTSLPTQVTRERGVRESSWDSSPHEANTEIMKDQREAAPQTPWYAGVAVAGALAFALVWFLASPGDESVGSGKEAPESAAAEVEQPTQGTPAKAEGTAGSLEPAKTDPKSLEVAAAPDASSQKADSDANSTALGSDTDSLPALNKDELPQDAKVQGDTKSSGAKEEGTLAAADAESSEENQDSGSTEELDSEKASLANLPTPTTCREGYLEIPGSETLERFCIQELEYHGGEKRPLRKIKYDEAIAKCEAESSRLCSAEEFSAACGGPFPYGERFIRKKCNVMGDFFDARPVRPGGSFPGCKSPFGVMDLSGNVAEWVDGALLAGGNSGQEGKSVSCSRTIKRKPNKPTRRTGFRCCHELQ